MIQAIETLYAGCRFRSRAEARWAVFFDELKIKWEYEKEGYSINGRGYLPDFWLPDSRSFFEVKPGDYRWQDYSRTAQALNELPGHPFAYLAVGVPARHFRMWEFVHKYRPHETTNAALLGIWAFTGDKPMLWERIDAALLAAQQARFEWGESGAAKRTGHRSLDEIRAAFKRATGRA